MWGLHSRHSLLPHHPPVVVRMEWSTMARSNMLDQRGRLVLLVEVSLTVALATVLSFIKLWEMPQGGSISLAMLPLFIISLRRGAGAGLVAGALYGVVDAIIEPYVVHWIQFVLDYPLAFAAVGLAGLGAAALARAMREGRHLQASGIVVASVALGALGRYAAHVVSGVVYFASYAKGQPVLAYSLVYNSFVLVSAVACAIAALAIVPVLARVVPVPARSARA